MDVITSWITNIIILILFATILELLLPNSKMQRYVKLVVGLMLLMVMIQPLLSIFQVDPEEWLSDLASWDNSTVMNETSLIESKKIDIEQDGLAYISEQAAVLLKKQASKELEKQFEVVPLDVYITFEPFQNKDSFSLMEMDELLDNLSDVYVLLSSAEEMEVETTTVEIVKIDPVKIAKLEEKKEEQESDSLSEIRIFLSSLWEIPEELIHVEMKGGEE